MTSFYLRVIGKPELLLDDIPIGRIRTRRLWGVLAYLALSPAPVARATLAQTFWPDVDDPRVNLRVALHQLRADHKTSPFEDDGKFLRLADGVNCDAVEFRKALHCAQKASDRTEKRASWEIAASLERGDFLEGLDGDWVLQQRARFLYECREFLEELMVLQREDGDLDAAAKTAVKLLRYQVDHPEANRLALAHSDHQELAERATLEKLVATTLASWSPARLARLHALAVFPATFTEEAAFEVTEISPSDLKQAVRSGVVVRDGAKLSLGAVARNTLWERLTDGQRCGARRSHAQWTVDRVLSRSPDRFGPVLAPYLRQRWIKEEILSPDDICQYVVENQADIHAACKYSTKHNDITNADIFFILLCDYFVGERHILTPYSSILINKWEAIQKTPYYRNAACLLAMFSVREKQLTCYFQEFLGNFVDTDYSIDPNHFQAATETAMLFFHQTGEDSEFDRVLRQRMDLLRRFPEYPLTATAHLHIAENSLARKRFAYALLHNEPYFQYGRKSDNPYTLAIGLLQRGAIFKGLAQKIEARSCWNEALVLYEEAGNVHGQASCLEAIATLHREDRAFGEAQALLREAIRLFRQSGDDAAVHATEGSLGDVLRDRGAFDEAERFYRQGLEFWRERGHTRWVKRFEERLTTLNECRGMSIK